MLTTRTGRTRIPNLIEHSTESTDAKHFQISTWSSPCNKFGFHPLRIRTCNQHDHIQAQQADSIFCKILCSLPLSVLRLQFVPFDSSPPTDTFAPFALRVHSSRRHYPSILASLPCLLLSRAKSNQTVCTRLPASLAAIAPLHHASALGRGPLHHASVLGWGSAPLHHASALGRGSLHHAPALGRGSVPRFFLEYPLLTITSPSTSPTTPEPRWMSASFKTYPRLFCYQLLASCLLLQPTASNDQIYAPTIYGAPYSAAPRSPPEIKYPTSSLPWRHLLRACPQPNLPGQPRLPSAGCAPSARMQPRELNLRTPAPQQRSPRIKCLRSSSKSPR